jgi:PAT family beta-lactamase induction signal transducer AmpG
MLTNLLFVSIAILPPDIIMLALVVGADNLSGGMAGSAFIAFLSGLTNKAYTATQYALFSSLMLLPAKFIGGFSGDVVDANGYVFFFVYTAMLGIPAILLILYLMKRKQEGNIS